MVKEREEFHKYIWLYGKINGDIMEKIVTVLLVYNFDYWSDKMQEYRVF
jgi:hypothetical protein